MKRLFTQRSLRAGALAAGLMLVLVACATQSVSLAKLQNSTMTDEPFLRALATGYLNYATAREQRGDHFSAEYFASKGLQAADGSPVTQENPANWQIDVDDNSILMRAHQRLNATLAHPQIDKEPSLAAHTILAYDCWVDQRAGGDDVGMFRRCQQDFFERYAELTGSLKAHTEAEAAAILAVQEAELAIQKAEEEAARLAEEQARKEAEQQQKPAVQSTSTIIYFPFDSAVPDDKARALLDELIRYVLTINPTEVLVHGHADRAGSERYNLNLSERRAAYVRDRLVNAGVADGIIEHYGFGESDPKVATQDGVRESANRRVEIFIQ